MLLAQDPAPDAVNAPPVVSAPAGDREEQVSLASVARAATRGVQVYPSVSSAEFAITGDPRAPHLTLTLAFTPRPVRAGHPGLHHRRAARTAGAGRRGLTFPYDDAASASCPAAAGRSSPSTTVRHEGAAHSSRV